MEKLSFTTTKFETTREPINLPFNKFYPKKECAFKKKIKKIKRIFTRAICRHSFFNFKLKKKIPSHPQQQQQNNIWLTVNFCLFLLTCLRKKFNVQKKKKILVFRIPKMSSGGNNPTQPTDNFSRSSLPFEMSGRISAGLVPSPFHVTTNQTAFLPSLSFTFNLFSAPLNFFILFFLKTKN